MILGCCDNCETLWRSSRPLNVCPYCQKSRHVFTASEAEELPIFDEHRCECNAITQYARGATFQCCSACGTEVGSSLIAASSPLPTASSSSSNNSKVSHRDPANRNDRFHPYGNKPFNPPRKGDSSTLPTASSSSSNNSKVSPCDPADGNDRHHPYSDKAFKPPRKGDSSTGNVAIKVPAITKTTYQKILDKTQYRYYRCGSFVPECERGWASDMAHTSKRCPYCNSSLFDAQPRGDGARDKSPPDILCRGCGCMIHYHIENGKPSWCPSCGDPLPKINDDIKKFLLSFIRVRSSKYPVDKDLICSGRINFRQQLKVDMPSKKDEHGKWLHRRHIIPQHLLRNAWNVAVRKHKPDDKELKKMLDKLGGSGKFDNSQPLASAILYTLNENKNNLFLDDGTANSAIGAFAHSLCDLVEKHTRLQSSKPDIIKEFKEIKTPPLWGKDVKNKVKDDIATYTLLLKQQSTAGEVLELLEDLADTANLDLDTAQGLKSQNRNAIRLYGKFGDWVKTPGSWEEFIELACDFMNTKMTDAS